jgi:hypothetical protein
MLQIKKISYTRYWRGYAASETAGWRIKPYNHFRILFGSSLPN